MDKPVVEIDTTIGADVATVWKAMTGKDSALFPGTEVKTDWKVSHPITFTGEWNGKLFKDRGEIESFAEERELSFTHWSEKDGKQERPENYHLVRYALQPDGKQTKVRLSQFNLGKKTDIDAKTKAEFEKTWAFMLDGLRKAAEAA